MDNVSDIFSDTFLGLLFASAIWGITTIQVVTYYREFKSDPHYLKIAVGVVWVCDTMYIILEAAYFYNVLHGIWVKEFSQAAPIFGACVQSIVQIIYAIRLYDLCKQTWIPIVCCVGVVYEFGITIAYDLIVLNATFFQNEKKYRWLITSQFITSPIIEVIITATFCYVLLRDRKQMNQRTLRIIDKLVIWTIHSGLVTCVIAIVMVILNFTVNDSGQWLIFVLMFPTLYPVTLFSLLNGRVHLRSMNENTYNESNTFKFQRNQLPIGTKTRDLSSHALSSEDREENPNPLETGMEIATAV